jgi:NADH-quinone oxidoreductase subunit N
MLIELIQLGRGATLDLARQPDYFRALLPEIVLTLGAMLVLLADVLQKGNRSQPSRPWVPWLTVAVILATAVANFFLLGVTDVSTTGLVAVDGFRVFINFVFLISALLSVAISVGYLDQRGMNRGEFYALLLFATLGMMLMGAARDLMMVFVGLELMSISIYVLVGFDRADPRSAEASLKYFLLGAFSSGFFLYGIALLFGSVGSTHLPAIASALADGSRGTDLMLLAGVALTMVGFAFKVAAIPFHMWTPDAYDGAPTPVTALMSTGVKAAAFASFIRVFVLALIGVSPQWANAVWWLAALTMVIANLVAVTQGSVKRMLAYSSIAHAGYLLVAVLAANDDGASAFLFYLLAYTVTTIGAFGIVTANARDGMERVTLEDYAGFGWQQPLLGGLFSIFLLSLAGFPLTAGFLGKLYILRAALESGHPELAVILVLASAVSYFYYLRVIIVMYMRPARSADEHRGLGFGLAPKLAVIAAGVAVVALFFFADRPLEWAHRSAGSLWTPPAPAVAALGR